MPDTNQNPVIPQSRRPVMPDGYGVPEISEGTLPWSFAEERLQTARNYWIGSVRPSGRPHAMPVWGVWMDQKLYMDGSPETRRSRNIASNPAVVVHLESGDQVVIVEGEAYAAGKPDPELAKRLAQAYSEKYAASGYQPEPGIWDQGGLYVVYPHTAFAWTKFPSDSTKWIFNK
jgi:hypothetical protein